MVKQSMTSKLAHKRGVNRQSGFTLLEVLLTVGVAGTFLLFIIGIGQAIAERQASRAAANYVAQINKAVDYMLSDPALFTQLYNAVGAPLIRQASVADLINGTGVLAGMNRNPMLSANFPLIGPMRQTYRIIFRVADDFADPADSEALEVYVLSETRLLDKTAMDIATALGGNGGALRDTATPATANLRGIYGSWIVPMTDLAGTAWHAAVIGAAPPTLRNGSYVASYTYVDINRIARDYLYRNNMGDPDLNMMRSDLSLGGFNLLGVDDIATTGMLSTDQILVNGNARLQGGMIVNGNLQIDGPTAVGSITSGGAAQIAVAGGTFNVANRVAADAAGFQTLNTEGLTADGDVTTEDANLNASTLTVASGVFATSDGFSAGGTTVGGQLRTSDLTTGALTVQSGNTGMIFMETSGNFSQSGGTSKMDVLSVSTPGTLTRAGGSTNWSCSSGCGE